MNLVYQDIVCLKIQNIIFLYINLFEIGCVCLMTMHETGKIYVLFIFQNTFKLFVFMDIL